MAAETRTAGAGLLDIGGAALAWWLDELRALVPGRLLARLDASPRADAELTLDAEGNLGLGAPGDTAAPILADEDRAAALAAHLRQKGRAPAVALAVPRALCLLRTSQIPRRALAHAPVLLAAELDETTAFGAAGAYADWYVEIEDPQTHSLRLRHVVLKRDRVAWIAEAVTAAGGRLVSLRVGEAEGRPLPVDLLAGREAGLRATLRRLPISAKILWTGAAALAFAALLLAFDRQERLLEALETARVEAARSLPRGANAAAASAFMNARAARPQALVLLDEIASRLPPDAWLQRLSLTDAGIDVVVAGAGGARARDAFVASPLLVPHDVEVVGDVRILRLAFRPAGEAAPPATAAAEADPARPVRVVLP